jgi:hypothetical protein
MRTRRTRRWVCAAGAVAALLGIQVGVQAVGQAPALALPGTVVRDDLTAFNFVSPKTASADCPPGKRVIGGGGRINGGGHVVLTRLQPVHTNNLDHFEVTAIEDSAGADSTWAVQAYAICADPLPGLRIVSETAGPGPDPLLVAQVSCPSGVAIGGGGRVTGGQGRVHLSGAAGQDNRGSLAVGREDSSGFPGNWTVTSYAVCANISVNSVDMAIQATPQDSTSPKIETAECPAGMRVTGGGLAVTGDSPAVVLNSISPDVEVGGVPGTEVQGIGRENSATGDQWRLVVSAYCAA